MENLVLLVKLGFDYLGQVESIIIKLGKLRLNWVKLSKFWLGEHDQIRSRKVI